MKIEILMATYNGSRFIKQQLDSVLCQTNTNWVLKIRDDGSTDDTLALIKEYQLNYPNKIEIIDDNKGNIGIVNNYSTLLLSSSADYIMFCDQDDVWLPFKIEKTLNKMLETEKNNNGKPVLVHTDMKVVDSNLTLVSDSFFEYQNLKPCKNNINNLLVQNNVTGCTIMINKQLRDKFKLPFSSDVIMHDWFIALNAAIFGIIAFIPEATLLYRQHESNSIGAKGYNFSYVIKKFKDFFINDSIKKCQLQAEKIYVDNEIIKSFINLRKSSFFERKTSMFKYRFFKSGLLRNIGLFFVI